MVSFENGRLSINGAISMDNAHTLMQQGLPHLNSGAITIDLAQTTEVDSSALALLLEWRRSAQQRQQRFEIVNIPPSLRTLADLYGVYELVAE